MFSVKHADVARKSRRAARKSRQMAGGRDKSTTWRENPAT